MHANSLRQQLLRRLLWPLAAMLLLGAIFAYFFARHTAINAYDLGLLDDALDISKQIELHQGQLTLNLPPAATEMLRINNQDRVSYAARDSAGVLIAGNPNLQVAGDLDAEENYLFRDITLNGQEERAMLLRNEIGGHPYQIVVAQTVRGRNHLTGVLFASILIPEVLLAAVSIAVILLGVRRGLLPVEQLRDEIASRSSSDLRAIEESSAPTELAPIIHGINELLGNLATAFAGHRRFIADAAHQLRTPLAALSSQLEVALQAPPADNRELLNQLLATTRRTTHLANQLLSLARLEHTEQAMYEVASVDLQDVVLATAADFVTQGARKQVELSFDLKPARIKGSPLMLRELLSNLLDNAVRYTTAGGQVHVSLLSAEAGIMLTVADNGPGVPVPELDKLGTPFHRLSADHPEGCGLGLAIVREIARLHGASIRFAQGANGRGLQVNIQFPPQAH